MIRPMTAPYLLVTGFGAFETVLDNPSGRLAEALNARPDVIGVRVPVTYGGVGDELQGILEGFAQAPAGILAMGVHRGPNFRLEVQAGAVPPSARPDTDGVVSQIGPRALVASGFDLAACEQTCQAVTTHPVYVSQDAGGYVCDFLYGIALRRAQELGVQALFLHVPPLDAVPFSDQEPVVQALVDELLAQARAGR
ncbi:MAG: pyrrolidone-carboxylate peptidase [Glaciecola sp.]|jgi:pyrrolidone-carboxylate peptidase